MIERKLRRQRVVFYISRSLENTPEALTSNAALREYYLTLLDQLETEFDARSPSAQGNFRQRRDARAAHDRRRPFQALQNFSQSVAGRPV